ncbi:unnamed protein product [marine sediment metagenome]|uniref:Uncharacterized protein n=1 Tax=marine sediment metagenome TaxID=412755 RepID=X1VT20_9ZZZZ
MGKKAPAKNCKKTTPKSQRVAQISSVQKAMMESIKLSKKYKRKAKISKTAKKR